MPHTCVCVSVCVCVCVCVCALYVHVCVCVYVGVYIMCAYETIKLCITIKCLSPLCTLLLFFL